MRIRVNHVELFIVDCATRLPFQFGSFTLTWAPLLTVRVRIETDTGQVSEGLASDLLVPKWFEKDPNKSLREDIENLIDSTRRAVKAITSQDLKLLTVFDLWWQVYGQRVQVQDSDTTDLLVRGFGVALLERAVMDATCRAAGMSFFEALRADLFHFMPEKIHSQLVDWNLSESLSSQPLSDLSVRHTVGLADYFRISEIPPSNRIHDGFPQALEEDIDRYGVTYFKIKVGGDPQKDLPRLLNLAQLVKEKTAEDAHFTLDANEQYQDLIGLVNLLEQLHHASEGRWLLERLLFIEQPLPRIITFNPSANIAIPAISKYAPVIIDEADWGIDAFPQAMTLGYRGVSVKNCKGIFRALINRGLCEVSDGFYFQSAEDLTNLPILPIQQNLATIAALGFSHAELNGHHYFRGLGHLPEKEAVEAVSAHPDLYAFGESGISLNIQNGQLHFGSIQVPGYGYNVEVSLNERTPINQWVCREL